MVKGLYVLCSKLFKRWDLPIAYSFLGLLLGWSFASIIILSASNLKHQPVIEGPYSATSIELFKFLKDSTAKESLIAYWKPRAMLLYTGRNSIVPHNYSECIERDAAYYVHYRKAYCDQMAMDSLTLSPERFKFVYGNPDFKVFEILNATFTAPRGADITPPNGSRLVRTIDHNFFDASLLCCEPDKLIGIWSNGPVKAMEFRLLAGKYILSVYSRGTKAGNEFPLNKVILNDDTIGTFYGKAELSREDFPFELNSDKIVSLAMKMNNDLQVNERNEDRNTLLYFMNIYKVSK